MTQLPQKLRFQTCHNLLQLIRMAETVRAMDVYWRQYVRMADRVKEGADA